MSWMTDIAKEAMPNAEEYKYVLTGLCSVQADLLELERLLREDWAHDFNIYDKVVRWRQATWDRMERIIS